MARIKHCRPRVPSEERSLRPKMKKTKPNQPQVNTQPGQPPVNTQPSQPTVNTQHDQPQINAQPDQPNVNTQPSQLPAYTAPSTCDKHTVNCLGCRLTQAVVGALNDEKLKPGTMTVTSERLEEVVDAQMNKLQKYNEILTSKFTTALSKEETEAAKTRLMGVKHAKAPSASNDVLESAKTETAKDATNASTGEKRKFAELVEDAEARLREVKAMVLHLEVALTSMRDVLRSS